VLDYSQGDEDDTDEYHYQVRAGGVGESCEQPELF
jgi:hypothetical protein